MKEDLLLTSADAQAIYQEIKDLPLIDFHNHLSVDDIASDRRYSNLHDLWIACDPYKHRLMRITGIGEEYITGQAAPFEKFKRFCEIFPYLAGNPVYDWSRMELSRIFGINDIPCSENAAYIYDKCAEMLSSDEFSTRSILKSFGIEYQSPVAALTEDLSGFERAKIAPSLRADDLLLPTDKLLSELTEKTEIKITDDGSYMKAVSAMLDKFKSLGCRFADHSLDSDFFTKDIDKKQTQRLVWLAGEYSKRGMVLLLHLGAKRQTSTRLAKLAGPAGGYAAVGGSFDLETLIQILDEMEKGGGLPDTVLFPLNINDQAALSVLQGSFCEDNTPSKVQLGPAWWWCDHRMGIENTLSSISSFGVLSEFIGMTTDSRSILSFVRHDYFRRILCSFLERQNRVGDWLLSKEQLVNIAKKICYENAKRKIGK